MTRTSIAILLSLLPFFMGTSCRQAPEPKTSMRTGTSSAGDADKGYRQPATDQFDDTVLEERGWPEDVVDTGTAVPAGARGKAIGVFRLGANLADVRVRARKAGMRSTGEFRWNGPVGDAWCAPPKAGSEGHILAPRQLVFQDGTKWYSIDLIPVGGQLQVGAVQLTGATVTRIGPDTAIDARYAEEALPYVPCRLTLREGARLRSWDRIENLKLRDMLGVAELNRQRLPNNIDASLVSWERSVAVKCSGGPDCHALTPLFDGFWQKDGTFVVSYAISLSGDAPRLVPFTIVVDPDGRISWIGETADYERDGLKGRQRAPR